MDSAPSQLNFERPLELCDFMYLELQKLRKRKDLRSKSQFNHFHSQRSALIDLLAICFKRLLDSDIEEADSAPSQLNFELPPELCDLMFLELQKLRNLEMEDLRSQLQSNDFHSKKSAWTDLLAICNKRYMETMDSEIEEADSAPSQLNFERLLEDFIYWELQGLRKRNLEMQNLWSQLQFSHFHYEIICLTDILATCSKKWFWNA